MLEVPRPTEIIFGARAGDRGKLIIAIQVKLDLAFAPPTAGIHTPGEVGPDVMALSGDTIQQGVHGLVRQRVRASPLGMKVGRVIRHRRQRVGHLIVKATAAIGGEILDRDARAFAERHLPVAVESAGRVDGDRDRTDVAALAPSVRVKVAQRRFDRRRRFIIPMHANDEPAPPGRMNRQPDVLNRARPLDVRHGDRFVRTDLDARTHLPALTEFTGGNGAGAIGRHAPLPSFASEIFRTDRTRFRVGKLPQIPEVIAESVEIAHAGSSRQFRSMPAILPQIGNCVNSERPGRYPGPFERIWVETRD